MIAKNMGFLFEVSENVLKMTMAMTAHMCEHTTSRELYTRGELYGI